MSHVHCDENGEGDKQIFVQHLVVRNCLIVVLQHSNSGELGDGEEDHHVEAVEVGRETGSTNFKAVDDGLQGVRFCMETA